MPFNPNDLLDHADIARRLEEILADHPYKELPPDLLRDIASLNEGKCEPVPVIERAMEMVDAGEEITRQETLLALGLIIEYLSATAMFTPWPHSLLSKLREAIFELESGLVHPVLRPNKPNHRMQDSPFMRKQKMLAAAACGALIQLNEGREKSAGLIAALLNKIGFRPNGRRCTTITAVLYWRQKFRGELDFEANEHFFRAMAWSNARDPALNIDKRRLHKAWTYVKRNKHRFPRESDELAFIVKQAMACSYVRRPELAVDKKRVLEALSDLMRNQLRFPRWTDGAFLMKNGKLYRRHQGHATERRFSADDHDRVRRLVGMRDLVKDVVATQLRGEPATVLRDKLQAAYNAFVKKYGPINRVVSTVTSRLNEAGEPVVIVQVPNFEKFARDPDAYLVAALEHYDRDSDTAVPSAIQTEDGFGPFALRANAGR